MSIRVIAGIGCRRDCSIDDILSAVDRAYAATGRQAHVLSAPVFKSDKPELHEAARRLGLPLVLVDTTALSAAQKRCMTHSHRAKQAVGIASVAEGCALAVTGASGRLLLPRITSGAATCALAEESSV